MRELFGLLSAIEFDQLAHGVEHPEHDPVRAHLLSELVAPLVGDLALGFGARDFRYPGVECGLVDADKVVAFPGGLWLFYGLEFSNFAHCLPLDRSPA